MTQISEAFPLRRSMGRLDSVDRVGLVYGMVVWTVWIVWALWTVWPYGRYGLMDGVGLVDGMVSMWPCAAVCGGLYGMPDLL